MITLMGTHDVTIDVETNEGVIPVPLYDVYFVGYREEDNVVVACLTNDAQLKEQVLVVLWAADLVTAVSYEALRQMIDDQLNQLIPPRWVDYIVEDEP